MRKSMRKDLDQPSSVGEASIVLKHKLLLGRAGYGYDKTLTSLNRQPKQTMSELSLKAQENHAKDQDSEDLLRLMRTRCDA